MRIIPEEIAKEEPIIRLIFTRFHYSTSKDKLRPEAFMPSPREVNEFSVMRFNYTDIDSCKERGLNIIKGDASFIGVAFFLNQDINEISYGYEDGNCSVVFTPLDINNSLRKERPVNQDDDGTPSHSDVRFEMFEIEENKPMKQRCKVIAKKILAKAKDRFYKDDNLSVTTWQGSDIII